jgi:succinate dehydrogenase / fumarate reductase iron-sulfur subunit
MAAPADTTQADQPSSGPEEPPRGGQATFEVWRGDEDDGEFETFEVETQPGMVVLDAMHEIQADQAPDLAVRWNCKAGKCGSCSAEVNGHPKLMCMTRLEDLEEGPIHVAPMKTFPVEKDLVCDVSWNYEQNEEIEPFDGRELETPAEKEKGEFRMQQEDLDRVQEFRKCIECYLCQDVCHVLRNHDKYDAFQGPRFMIRYAGVEMHPADDGDRVEEIWDEGGIGYCNITKCCTDVCPADIEITDNGIIPMKERVASEKFDPLAMLWQKVRGED